MLMGELSTPVKMSGEIYRGAGVSDYNDLENKPTYNGHIIEGDLTSESLGIWQPTIFSTEEKKSGIWIDNTAIYSKTIEVSNLISGNNIISHNITNLKMTVANISFIFDINGVTNQLPTISTVNGWSARIRDFTNTSFVIELGSEIARYYTNAKVTLYYTKTID